MFEEMRMIMGNHITIDKASVLEAYKYASEEHKKVLEELFGNDMFFPKDITERIKTFHDAVSLLGYDNQTVIDYHRLSNINSAKDIIAFAKLRVITEALNEGWKPTFDREERRYYPWFFIYQEEEYKGLNEDEKKGLFEFMQSYNELDTFCGVVFACAGNDSSYTNSSYGYRLALKTKELAAYCGRQFIEIWADYLFA